VPAPPISRPALPFHGIGASCKVFLVSDDPARRAFRVLTRTRGGYNGATMYDVQLQAAATGNLLWAQTFTDSEQAAEFETRVERDLNELDDSAFRRKYGVPSSA
jgi:hypothetical protein